MGILDKILDKVRGAMSDELKILVAAENNINWIDKNYKLSKKGKFQVLIFNYAVAAHLLPRRYEQVINRTLSLLADDARKKYGYSIDKMEMMKHIMSRKSHFIHEDIIELINKEVHSANYSYYLFFVNPNSTRPLEECYTKEIDDLELLKFNTLLGKAILSMNRDLRKDFNL